MKVLAETATMPRVWFQAWQLWVAGWELLGYSLPSLLACLWAGLSLNFLLKAVLPRNLACLAKLLTPLANLPHSHPSPSSSFFLFLELFWCLPATLSIINCLFLFPWSIFLLHSSRKCISAQANSECCTLDCGASPVFWVSTLLLNPGFLPLLPSQNPWSYGLLLLLTLTQVYFFIDT